MNGVALPSFNVLSVCTGIGGLELGLGLALPTARTVVVVERESFAAAQLVAHMAAGVMDPAPIWDDLGSFDGGGWRGCVDALVAGFPCQPWSAAGSRKGTQDDRWIWPGINTIIRDSGVTVVFLENVPPLAGGHAYAILCLNCRINRGVRSVAPFYDDARHCEVCRTSLRGRPGFVVFGAGITAVLSDLAQGGFDAVWGVFSVAEVGGSHKRERLFILAYRDGDGLDRIRECGILHRERTPCGDDTDGLDEDVVVTDRTRRPQTGQRRPQHTGRESQPGRRRVANGVGLADTNHTGSQGRHRRDIEERPAQRVARTSRAPVADATGGGQRKRRQPSGGAGLVDRRDAQPLADTRNGQLPESERGSRGRDGFGSAIPLFPPGPNDRSAWRRILEIRPDLAPAVADAVCERRQQDAGSAHGDEVTDEGRSKEYDHEPSSAVETMEDPARLCEHGCERENCGRGWRVSQTSDAGDVEHASGAMQHPEQEESASAIGGRSVLEAGLGGSDPVVDAVEGEVEPTLRDVADGTANRVGGTRVDQLRALGNGVVPLEAAYGFAVLAARAGLWGEGTE